MSWLVGELLVALQTLLGIPEIFLKRTLAILLRQRRHSVAVKETQIVQVASIGERVLREDNVTLAIAGFIEQRRNEATRVSAAHVNHFRAKRTQHGDAVVEKLLCGPVVRGVGRALGLDNRAPVRAIPGPVGSTLALFAQGFVDGLHLIVAACLGRVEEPLKFVRERNFEVLGHGVGELPATASELREFVPDDFLRRGRRLNAGRRIRQTFEMPFAG